MRFKPSLSFGFSPWWILVFAIASNIVPPMAIDVFTPSFPAMLHFFSTSESFLQSSVTLYLLGFSITSMAVGLAADFLGRKKVFLLFTPLFFLGAFVSIFASSITVFLLGRVLQGAGAAGSGFIGPVVISDTLDKPSIDRASAWYSTAYAIIPIVAPFIGGELQEVFNWQASFVFLSLITVVIYLLFFIKLPETHIVDKSKVFSLQEALSSFKLVLTNPTYMLYVLCMILNWSSLMVFSITAPFILEEKLGLTPVQYGSVALLVGAGVFVGNLTSTLLLRFYTKRALLRVAISLMVLMGATLVTFSFTNLITVVSLMTPVFFFMVGAGLCFPLMFASAVAAIPGDGGIGSALIGALICLGAVIVMSILTVFQAQSVHVFAFSFLSLPLAIFLCFCLARVKNREK